METNIIKDDIRENKSRVKFLNAIYNNKSKHVDNHDMLSEIQQRDFIIQCLEQGLKTIKN